MTAAEQGLADEVGRDCTAVFPSFRAYRAEHGWYFECDAGELHAGGLFLLLGWMLREQADLVTDDHWRRLGAAVRGYFDRGEPARGLVGSCLLGPLEGPPCGGHVLRHFDPEVLRYYHFEGAVPMHTRGELLDAAWEVARRFRAHGGYGSEPKACQALRRRRPGFTDRQYVNALRKGLALYDVAVEVVARDVGALLRQTDVGAERFPDFRDLAREVRPRCPGFPAATYRAALTWVFYQFHLR